MKPVRPNHALHPTPPSASCWQSAPAVGGVGELGSLGGKPSLRFMSKEPDQSDVNAALADFCLSLDCRLMALEILCAERFYQNEEQKEAFHADVSAKYEIFYQARLKQGEKIEPMTISKIRALTEKTKETGG